MTPIEMMRDAVGKKFTTEDGDPLPLELMPPLSGDELLGFEATLPSRLPAEIRDLLSYCRGFTGPGPELVDFTGRECAFECEPAFPHGLPIAADGFGNFWVVDLLPSSTTWGPIYFACHDAPVILYQAATLEDFLEQTFQLSLPPYKSLLDDVHEDRLFRVWRTNPGVRSHDECLQSDDPELVTFAKQLGPTFQIVDLRSPKIGFGFSWGRYGPRTVVRRYGERALFAYARPAKKGVLARLFSRSA